MLSPVHTNFDRATFCFRERRSNQLFFSVLNEKNLNARFTLTAQIKCLHIVRGCLQYFSYKVLQMHNWTLWLSDFQFPNQQENSYMIVFDLGDFIRFWILLLGLEEPPAALLCFWGLFATLCVDAVCRNWESFRRILERGKSIWVPMNCVSWRYGCSNQREMLLKTWDVEYIGTLTCSSWTTFCLPSKIASPQNFHR